MPLPSDSPITNRVSTFIQRFHDCSSHEIRINCTRNSYVETRILAARQDAEIESFMYHPDLVVSWNAAINDDEVLQTLGTTYTFHIVEQANVHSYDLFKGVFYMDEVHTIIESPELSEKNMQAVSLIKKSEKCNYFPAMEMLNELNRIANNYNDASALRRVKRCARLYGSSGYLELAKYYRGRAEYLQLNNQQEQAQSALLEALVALQLAIEVEADCSVPIYNAYGDEGMPKDEIAEMKVVLTCQCRETNQTIEKTRREAENWRNQNPELLAAASTHLRVCLH